MRSRRILAPSIVLTIIALLAALASPTFGADLNESKGFRKAVTLAGIREHQAALQEIADANAGTRSSGTPGYRASADYVAERLEAAGYDATLQPFPFAFYRQLAPSTFERTSPLPVVYTEGSSADYTPMTYSGSGNVTGTVTNVGGLGCEAANFAGFTPGNIALISRGTCTFAIKAANAQAVGATAVVIYNNVAGPLNGTLGAPNFTIPVLGTTQAIGTENVALGPGVVFHIVTSTDSETRTTWNVIAETASGDPNRVVVVGAHLDSRLEGPGINDNGSGSAAILEIAEVFAAQNRDARNKLRFMWYGAEEFNLLGSQFYVNSLSQAERDKIMAMVNFDMVGSPNYVRFVYDGDNSAFPVGPGAAEGPPGSAYLETLFVDYFNAVGLANDRPVQWPLGLRPVHRGRHPGRRAVHGRRRHQDRGPGGHVWWHRRDRLRPVLPPGVRHVRQQQQHRARSDVRRGCPRHPDALASEDRRA